MITRLWQGPTGLILAWLEINDKCWTDVEKAVVGITGGRPPAAFREALNDALTAWNCMAELHETNKPADMKRNLRSAMSTAGKFLNKLKSLDGNSRQLISEFHSEGFSVIYRRHVDILTALESASQQAENLPNNREGIQNYAPAQFAAHLFSAIKNYCGREYSRKGKPKLFNELYRILVEQVIHPEQKKRRRTRVLMALDVKAVQVAWKNAREGDPPHPVAILA